MTTPRTSDAIHLINLAERMGIPADEAIRQVGLLIAETEEPAELPAESPAVVPAVASTAVA